MNTRRLTKKYKNKSKSKKTRKSRRSKRSRKTRRRGGRRGRRIMKGGVPSVSRRSSASVRPSSRPSSGIIVSRTSGRGSSIRPSSSAGISKHRDNRDNRDNFNFHDFYNNLMNTPNHELHSTLQNNKYMYIKNTTFQTFVPKGAYLNMKGLKFVNYLHGKYKSANEETKTKIRSIISLFDQCGMSQGVRYSDLAIIKEHVDTMYYACYEKLYNDVYKKLFDPGNDYPVSLSAIPICCKPRLQTVHEDVDE
jgi:hypothetical protein